MRYLLNPGLPLHPAKADTWQGNPIKGKEFQYVQDPFRPDWFKFLRLALLDNPLWTRHKRMDWTPPVNPDTRYLNDRSQDWIVSFGHACFLFQFAGKRYLTDPQLNDMPLVPRRFSLPFAIEDLRGIDYLLLSHDHRDHVDEDSIKKIVANNQLEKILCPLGLSKTIGNWVGNVPIEEAGWYQQYSLETESTKVTFLPARHWCRRGLLDFNRSLWGSFMLEYAGHAYYFGGDSAQTSYWTEIGQLFPNIRCAFLGIGAYAPPYMMRDNHADPAEAFWGFQELGAQYWWPMHHGAYDLSKEKAGAPIRWATELMVANGWPDRLLQPPINEPWLI